VRLNGNKSLSHQENKFVISLKKYLDMTPDKVPASANVGELFSVVVKAYRSALTATGASAFEACPPVGSELQKKLALLEKQLENSLTVPLVQESERKVGEQLVLWKENTQKYCQARTAEVTALLTMLASTAASVGERDQRYTEHFSLFTSRLRKISSLEDVTLVRASLIKEALELKTYVVKMDQDSHQLVGQLKAQVSTYEKKIKEVEEIALRDSLTGLANRRNVEERIEWRIARNQPFCIAMLDLNGFKRVNDEHGHVAGDSMLQQFAQELRAASRAGDVVGRWGGDEFMMVIDSDIEGATAQFERLQKWVFGEYTIRPGKGSGEVKIQVDAAIGLTQWLLGQTLEEIVEQADKAMYKRKEMTRSQHA
jgi:diguanylate cyclase (GGDEF)-like protein